MNKLSQKFSDFIFFILCFLLKIIHIFFKSRKKICTEGSLGRERLEKG